MTNNGGAPYESTDSFVALAGSFSGWHYTRERDWAKLLLSPTPKASTTIADPTETVVRAGNIPPGQYDAFFGFTDASRTVDWAYILFDIDQSSSVDPWSDNFSVTLKALGQPALGATNSPDPDAMGRLVF